MPIYTDTRREETKETFAEETVTEYKDQDQGINSN